MAGAAAGASTGLSGQGPEEREQPDLGDLNSFPAFGNKDILQGKFKFLALQSLQTG